MFAEEPPAKDHPLLALPQVVVTPHLGASTEEAQSQVAVEGVGLLVDFLQTLTDETFRPEIPLRVPSGLPPLDNPKESRT